MKSKKNLNAIFAAAAILAGSFYAYYEGYIPKVGQGRKIAEELKLQIQGLQGNKIEQKIVELISNNSILNRLPTARQAEIKASLQDSFDNEVDLNFTYEDLTATTDDGMGVVEIIKPKLIVNSTTNPTQSFEVTLPQLNIAKNSNGKPHYYYSSKGEINIESTDKNSKAKTKILTIIYDKNNSELEFKDGYISLQKMEASNIKFVEGRGGTTIFSIGEINNQTTQSKQNDKIEIANKASYKNIVLGDMIKLFVGNIPPANVDINYAYTGEDALNMQKTAGFEGKLQVHNLAVKFDDSGVEADANLDFKKQNVKNIPYGSAEVRFTNYAKLISYITKYYPVSAEEAANFQKFIMAVGADEGQDISFDLKLDGTDKLVINGKSQQEFEKTFDKYFPKEEAKNERE